MANKQELDLSERLEALKDFSTKLDRAVVHSEECQKLLQEKFSSMRSLVDSLMNSPLSTLLTHKKLHRDTLKKSGGLCWNACVKYSSSNSTVVSSALPHTLMMIQLRVLACDLITIGWLEADDYVNHGVKRNMKVAELLCRIGREWGMFGEYEKAEQAFKHAMMYIDKVMKNESSDSVVTQEEYRAMVNTTICRIENLWRCGAKEVALSLCRESKGLIRKVAPSEMNRLGLLAFNFAVDLHEHNDFQNAIDWLRESLEIFEHCTTDTSRHARVLRLMSSCYLELQNFENALTCCQMANEKCKNHSGLYILAKIFFLMNRETEAITVVMEAINSAETPVNISLSLCQMASQFKVHVLAEQAYQKLLDLYSGSGDDRNQLVTLAYVEYLLRGDSGNGLHRAKHVLELVITNISQKSIILNNEMLKDFHILVWNQAVTLYEEKSYEDSLIWFQYSIKLLPTDDSFNRAKILRFMSRCYLNLKRPQEAEMVASDVETLDPNSQQTMYEFFKIFIQMKDVTKASLYLKKMVDAENFQAGVFALAAHDAHEVGCDMIALEALETLLTTKCNIDPKDKGLIIRNICLLCKQLGDVDRLIHYLRTMMEMLYALGVKEIFRKNFDEEIEWFYVLAWNTALMYGKQNQDWERAYILLKFTTDFARYRQFSLKILETQRNCMLMRVFCLLKISQDLHAKFEVQESIQKLELTLQEVSMCKQYSEKIKEIKRRMVSEESASNDNEYDRLEKLRKIEEDKSIPLVLLCEYQCKIMLKLDPKELGKVLEEARSERTADLKLFRLFAYMISSENCSCSMYTELANDVLRYCIQKGIESKSIDLKSIINYHRLWIDGCKLREDSYSPFESLYSVLSTHYSQEYDENESVAKLLRLLITKAWNNSVYFFKLQRLDKAEQWMAFCLKVANLFQYSDSQAVISREIKDITNIISNGYNKLLEKMQENRL